MMKKQIKYLLPVIAGLLLALALPAGAQGLYGNKKQAAKEETAASKPMFRSTQEDWDPENPGDPNPTETLPAGEGLILLAMLAGARCAVHGAWRKTKN